MCEYNANLQQHSTYMAFNNLITKQKGWNMKKKDLNAVCPY